MIGKHRLHSVTERVATHIVGNSSYAHIAGDSSSHVAGAALTLRKKQ